MNTKELGARLRLAREKNHLSQEELAEKASRRQRDISDFENGKRKMYVNDLLEFSRILQTPLVEFLADSITLKDLDYLMLSKFHALPDDKTKRIALDMMDLLIKVSGEG